MGREALSGICILDSAPELDFLTVTAKRTDTADGGVLSSGYELENFSYQLSSLLRVNYYDDYNFTTNEHLFYDFGLPDLMVLELLYLNTTDGSISFKGLLTGTKMKVLGSDEFLISTFYYDHKGRIMQSHCENHKGGYKVNYYSYDFSGKMIRKIFTLQEEGGAVYPEEYTYTYDILNKPVSIDHSLGKSFRTVPLLTYFYDHSQRLLMKDVGYKGVPTLYGYNARHQITKAESRLFSQYFSYVDGPGTPCYNGNISSISWVTENDTLRKGYRYFYDGLNRMEKAEYGENENMKLHPNRYTEQVFSFDKNSNILELQRFGQTGTNSYGVIDDLSLSYNGNQLTRVADSASASTNAFDFKDNAHATIEYSYDANGNLTKDLNKGISLIQYNCLNLPERIEFTDRSTVGYLYKADGTKLQVTHTNGKSVTTTDYCGNAFYENGKLNKLLTEGEGYVSFAESTPDYHFFIKDHLGNVRAVYNQQSEVEEMNHYYPFGGLLSSSPGMQPYKYNGKELDTKNGLNWHDYGARMYDAALGRWHAVDPLAEKYSWMSPYSYCGGDPVNNVDYDGRDWYLHSETGELYFNRDLNKNEISYHDRIYTRIGGNDMLGDMKKIKEKMYSFDESASLVKANGYSINPIQEIQSEVSEENSYSTGRNTVTIRTGDIDIVNEKYGIFPADKTIKVSREINRLKSNEYQKKDLAATILTGRKKADYIKRSEITYRASTSTDKVGRILGAIYNGVEIVVGGKHDYRNVKVYNSWDEYLKTTKGKGEMLKYRP